MYQGMGSVAPFIREMSPAMRRRAAARARAAALASRQSLVQQTSTSRFIDSPLFSPLRGLGELPAGTVGFTVAAALGFAAGWFLRK